MRDFCKMALLLRTLPGKAPFPVFSSAGLSRCLSRTGTESPGNPCFPKGSITLTEHEKMMAGMLYDPSDPELVALLVKARKLARRYNQVDEDDPETQQQLLRELLPASPELPALQAPVYFDYGCHTVFGRNCSANFHFVCLDVCPVHIGDNVLIGPNVTLATPLHPLVPEERNERTREDGSRYHLEYGKPITIESDCWLAANVVVCAGVTIGRGSVIGAGSVVTRDIPPYSLAVGNPCRVLRPITEADRLEAPR